MKNRRNFIKGTLLGSAGALLLPKAFAASTVQKNNPHSKSAFPMVISTWNHGLAANEAAMKVLNEGNEQYGWNSNKGYGTASHIKAIKELGPTKNHRHSFIKHMLTTTTTLF